MCPIMAVRDREGRYPSLAMRIEADVTCRSTRRHVRLRPWRQEVVETGQPAGVACRHCRAGRPILSPLIPGCSVAGDQDPSRFLVRAVGG